jgi:hypothetical protein
VHIAYWNTHCIAGAEYGGAGNAMRFGGSPRGACGEAGGLAMVAKEDSIPECV